ncbi:MAG: hypothetical protein AAFV59_17395 [Pseudomonadota bacterium]
MLLSRDLLRVAKARLDDNSCRNEAGLRRATSDLYYACFHSICEALVEPIGVIPDSIEFRKLYTKIYRQLDHGYAERRCNTVSKESLFDPSVSAFAKQFITMKTKREDADYDPLMKFSIKEVENHYTLTSARIERFWNCDSKIRSTFALYVGLRTTGGKEVTK